MFLATKFLAKVAQMIGNFLGNFEKPHSYVKTAVAIVWGNIWDTVYTNIWGQSYKHFTLVNYDFRVVICGIFQSGMTLES